MPRTVKMETITVSVSSRQKSAFRELSEREGLPAAELMRRALDGFLKVNEPEEGYRQPALVGK